VGAIVGDFSRFTDVDDIRLAGEDGEDFLYCPNRFSRVERER